MMTTSKKKMMPSTTGTLSLGPSDARLIITKATMTDKSAKAIGTSLVKRLLFFIVAP
jgi:hypothetical protein